MRSCLKALRIKFVTAAGLQPNMTAISWHWYPSQKWSRIACRWRSVRRRSPAANSSFWTRSVKSLIPHSRVKSSFVSMQRYWNVNSSLMLSRDLQWYRYFRSELSIKRSSSFKIVIQYSSVIAGYSFHQFLKWKLMKGGPRHWRIAGKSDKNRQIKTPGYWLVILTLYFCVWYKVW